MSKAPIGLFVPLVTPFHADESINFDAYKTIIDYTIENGMHGILVGGSTGEYHMMSLEERKELIKKGCEIANGRVPVMAGTGEYTAKETIELTNYAADCGAKWGLVLPPFYQQTSEEGIYEFFKEIAEGSKIGIVIYHNPGPTCVELSPEFIRRLALIDNIVAVKETIDERHTSQTYAAVNDIPDFAVMEAEEHLLMPTYSLGSKSAFSILFNLLPKEMREMYDLAVVKNDFRAAAELNQKLVPFYDLMEAEPYPGPVKAGLDAIGLPGGIVRKPLTQPSDEIRAKMREELKKLGYKVK
ncbi:4-hydroxy-tetrahydrodipicolinate synthase [Anaerotignum sp.]|uniref:4-hydroxy-tetrahydrodipicolinate synthase n=1 Tax=Anaerotignum sp. TaxID=2039241 RepID=UPI0027154F10|nr:4-hydroxy-tetrahydrodipicolinate synthase [Anaerotignum sp.]